MRKHALRRYLVFRVKAIEFLDIAALRQGLVNSEFVPHTPVGRTAADFAASMRTVHLSWYALLVDKSKDAMDAIELWRELFTKRKSEIENVWKRIKPAWDTLRKFRDKAGFHADKPIAFFKARRDIVAQQKEITEALGEFQQLLSSLLKAESDELPDLENAVDDFLDELETTEKHQYNRDEFKRYLMLPNTQGAHTKNPQKDNRGI